MNEESYLRFSDERDCDEASFCLSCGEEIGCGDDYCDRCLPTECEICGQEKAACYMEERDGEQVCDECDYEIDVILPECMAVDRSLMVGG